MLSYSRNDTVLLVAIAANVCALLFGWTIVNKSDAVLVRGHVRQCNFSEKPLLVR